MVSKIAASEITDAFTSTGRDISGRKGGSDYVLPAGGGELIEAGYTHIPRPLNGRAKNKSRTGIRKNIGIWFGSEYYRDVNFPLYSRIIRSLQIRLAAGGHTATVMNTNHGMPKDASILKSLDGAVMIGKLFSEQAYRLAKNCGLKIVFVLGYLDDSLGFSCDHIIPDNPKIGKLAAKYLIGRGHKYVGVVNSHRLHHTAMDIREDCFVNYCAAAGAKVVRFHIDFKDYCDGKIANIDDDPGLAALVEAFEALEIMPTGIFVPTDTNLVSVQKSLSRLGINAGSDVEFIGCNNEQALLSGLDVRPATIDIGIDKICGLAVERLFYRIEAPDCGGDGIVMSVVPKLVEGEVDISGVLESRLYSEALSSTLK